MTFRNNVGDQTVTEKFCWSCVEGNALIESSVKFIIQPAWLVINGSEEIGFGTLTKKQVHKIQTEIVTNNRQSHSLLTINN